ncbi:MAG: hypothetical protein PHE73_04690 [Sulfurovaceae bacterium]|nr:hypothetical protein [Sulfurovaceae bacterium]
MSWAWVWLILSTYWLLILGIIGLISAAVWAYHNWDDVTFWKMNFLYRWSKIGRMNTHQTSLVRDEESGWYDGEKRLCEDFYPRYSRFANATEKTYENCKSYLSKANEIGRSLRPFWLWIVLWIFVVGEATIFAKLILSFQGELSNNDIKWISVVIAFLLAMVLLFLTDKSGHELYTNSQIKKIRIWYSEDQNDTNKLLRPNLNVRLDNNDIDDNAPDYQQMLNRIKLTNAFVKPTYWWTIGTLSVIAFIAIAAFVERASLNMDMIEESASGAYMSYLFYSVVFLAIQAMGIGIGYLYGFASKEGLRAWRITHRYVSAEDYLHYPHREADRVAQLAQNRLGHLQKYILNKFPESNDEKTLAKMHARTFKAYIEEQGKKA